MPQTAVWVLYTFLHETLCGQKKMSLFHLGSLAHTSLSLNHSSVCLLSEAVPFLPSDLSSKVTCPLTGHPWPLHLSNSSTHSVLPHWNRFLPQWVSGFVVIYLFCMSLSLEYVLCEGGGGILFISHSEPGSWDELNKSLLISGWMHGWWVDGWMGEWLMDGIDEWKDWSMNGWMEGWVDDEWMDDGGMEGQMDDGWIDDEWIDEKMDGWLMDGWKDRWTEGWVDDGWMDGRTDG
jgi:hypothetical protein